MNDLSAIGIALAGWLASSWLGYRWGLRSQKIQSELAAASAIKNRRIDFLGFLKAWRLEVDRRHMTHFGYERHASAFTDILPDLIQRAEYLRADLPSQQKSEFDGLIQSLLTCHDSPKGTEEHHERSLRAIHHLIRNVENTK